MRAGVPCLEMAGDRLSGLDASFLHLEDASAHMHVASVMLFEGDPPPYDELIEGIERRLHLVPRYRQRLANVPLGQGRPKWVDDPHLNLRYHVRSTALPAPGSEEQLRALAGRVFSQQLDRGQQLVIGGRVALESHDRGHVHVRRGVLQVEEGRVQSGQPIACHGRSSGYRTALRATG